MSTFINQITNELNTVKDLFVSFIKNHSKIKYSPTPPGLIGFSDYLWGDLDESGMKAQTELYTKYNHLSEIIEVMFRDVPSRYLDGMNS